MCADCNETVPSCVTWLACRLNAASQSFVTWARSQHLIKSRWISTQERRHWCNSHATPGSQTALQVPTVDWSIDLHGAYALDNLESLWEANVMPVRFTGNLQSLKGKMLSEHFGLNNSLDFFFHFHWYYRTETLRNIFPGLYIGRAKIGEVLYKKGGRGIWVIDTSRLPTVQKFFFANPIWSL